MADPLAPRRWTTIDGRGAWSRIQVSRKGETQFEREGRYAGFDSQFDRKNGRL